MSVRKTTRIWPLLATIVLALIGAGCSDKDNNPTGASGNLELDSATVGQQSVSTISFVNDLVAGIDEMATGDLSGLGSDLGLSNGSPLREDAVAAWDAVQGAWVYDAEGTETDEFGAATYDVFLSVRFLNGAGVAQQAPDGTTARMDLVLDYLVDWHIEDEQSALDMVLDYEMDVSVAGLQTAAYQLDGNGDINVSLSLSQAGTAGSERVDLGMAWIASLDVPSDGGCPAGTATVSMEDWTFNAQYNGQGRYDWVLYERGTQVESGFENMSCIVPTS